MSSEKLSYSNTININNVVSRENLKDFDNLGELKMDTSKLNLRNDEMPVMIQNYVDAPPSESEN